MNKQKQKVKENSAHFSEGHSLTDKRPSALNIITEHFDASGGKLPQLLNQSLRLFKITLG